MMLIVQTGWRTYRRPDDKSGGHGVGWSPIIPYSFKVPDGWDEVRPETADRSSGSQKQSLAFLMQNYSWFTMAPT
jgi:uncharacterized protein YbdZ (MbtH family)